MNKLLATTAVALIAMASTASAQSVLERVLGQIDNATNLAAVNGTFANIAENIGGSETYYFDETNDVLYSANDVATLDALPTQAEYTVIAATDYVADDGTGWITAAAYANLSADEKAAYSLAGATAYYNDADGNVINAAEFGAITYATEAAQDLALAAFEPIVVAGLGGVDGSINNVVDGITEATETAVAGVVTAVEFNMPTLNFGDMATTALGAVNTGDITLGVNSSVDNAKTTSTEAVSSVMAQLGGSADTGAIVLNIASNMTGINGSINNTMTEVNGTVGALSTTALGAVNTGTIISGVNAAVTGITGASSGQSGL